MAVAVAALVVTGVAVATHRHHRPPPPRPATDHPSSPAERAAAAVYLGRCYAPGDRIRPEPRSTFFGCDGTGELRKMRWTAWTATHADGSGISSENDCIPDCGDGHLTNYPVVVHADRPVTCRAIEGEPRFYGRMVIAYTTAAPPGLQAAHPIRYRGMPAVAYLDMPGGCATPSPPP